MDAYYSHLRELLSALCRHAWATPGFWTVAAITVTALFFGAGTMARVIFGKDVGLVKAFLGMSLVTGCALAACAAWLTWGGAFVPALAGASVCGVLAALGALWLVAFLLRIPYGPAFGIAVFSTALLVGVAQGAGYLGKLITGYSVKVEPAPGSDSASR